MLTKEELLKSITLNQRVVKAFGGEVTIRNLTIKEMMDITSRDDVSILEMVSLALVEPKLTKEELGSLGSDYLADMTFIVNELNGSNDGKK